MVVSIILKDLSNNGEIRYDDINIDDKDNFSYLDDDNNICHISVYGNGLCINNACKDHKLVLHLLKDEGFAKIVTNEGEIKLNAKVVDFHTNNGILVMRYIIEDVEREIKLIYRS